MLTYPSKILLFGEHTVLYNSQALSIPFVTFSGNWQFNDAEDERLIELGSELDKTLINTAEFKKDCKKGLFFNSSIPQQSGLGSSGALTAALYKSYGLDIKTDAKLVQNDLAKIESIFHGQSSGTDALVSYLNAAIHSKENQSIVLEKNPLQTLAFHVYLYDSSVKRSAKQYINQFSKLVRSEAFNIEHVCNIVDSIIENILAETSTDLSAQLASLSKFQFSNLPMFIPEFVKTIWEEGLKKDSFYFKLCGAGGGGYFLIFSKNNLQDLFPDKLIALNKNQ